MEIAEKIREPTALPRVGSVSVNVMNIAAIRKSGSGKCSAVSTVQEM